MLLMTLITLATAQPVALPLDATARLTRPREVRQVLDGRNWACDAAGECTGHGSGASQPVMRECRRFVARFGPVSAFARGAVVLTAEQLAECNTAAR